MKQGPRPSGFVGAIGTLNGSDDVLSVASAKNHVVLSGVDYGWESWADFSCFDSSFDLVKRNLLRPRQSWYLLDQVIRSDLLNFQILMHELFRSRRTNQ